MRLTPPPRPPAVFLTAEWRHLAMANYRCDRSVLAPLVPPGTELDIWQGEPLVSVVGFMFLKTRVLGLAIPFHCNFAEVNLRFYVRRKVAGDWRRGVVFVRELVPRAAIALIARALYEEPYLAVPMAHCIEPAAAAAAPRVVEYSWRFRRREHRFRLELEPMAHDLAPGTKEEFITEHYWGYTARRRGVTSEYRVEHPPWRIQSATASVLDCDVTALYGESFRDVLACQPSSAFVAQGSPVAVYQGRNFTP